MGGYGEGGYGEGGYGEGAATSPGYTLPPLYPDRWGFGPFGRRYARSPVTLPPLFPDRFGLGPLGRRYREPIIPVGREMAWTCYLTIGRLGASGDCRFTRAGEPVPTTPAPLPRLRAPVVYVLDANRRPISCIDAYEAFEWEERWREPDEWLLRANIHNTGVEALASGVYIAAPLPSGELRVGVIEGRTLGVEGHEDSEVVEATGRCFGAHLEGRIALHLTDEGDGYDTWTETKGTAADAMVHYVTVNAISPAKVWRKVPHLGIGVVPATAARVAYNARFQPLTELLAEIGAPTGIGWQVRFDTATRGFLFEPLVGRDRTAEVVLSPTFGNVTTIGFSHSTRNARTIVQVAGQGEGADRVVRAYYDGRGGALVPSGLAVREMFVDARDIEVGDDAALAARALAKLQEAPVEQSVEFDLLEGGLYQYPRDFRVGDVIRAEYPGWASEVARIVAAAQRWDEYGRSVRVTVGSEQPDVSSVVITLARRQAVRGRV